MNTVFKLYLEAWLLLALGLTGGLALVWRTWPSIRPLARGLGGLVLVAGLIASLAYPLFVTPDRLRQRFDVPPGPTLDGLAFMRTGRLQTSGSDAFHFSQALSFDEDLALVNWMQTNLRGAPVVVEAMIGPYRGNGSRITNATGFPTVLGWDNHEGQQRWPEQIGPRGRAVRAFYTSGSPAEVLALVERYDVDYIVIGQLERLTILHKGHLGAREDQEPYASSAGLATLQLLAERGMLTEAFRQGETVLYQVSRPVAFPGDRAAQLPVTGQAVVATGHGRD
jgi:uncharacterized membrane protein